LTYRSDGSVYFRIAALPDYGKLARLDHDGMKAGARVDSDNYEKEDVRDFVLWKATKPGEPTWNVVDPPGRPGWHLECSAMALRLLGEPPIDIHGGGIDLIFPHHENEIAQAEGATGKPFSRFWTHVEFLNLDSEKMSKSLGNIFTVRDILDKGYRASSLRYLLISVHYRKQLTFNWDVLAQAEAAVTRLADFLTRVDGIMEGPVFRPAEGAPASEAITARVQAARDGVREAMASDLNVPAAFGAIFELVRDMHAAMDREEVGAADAKVIREAFDHFDRLFGVMSLRRAEDERPPVPEEEIAQLVEERKAARQSRNFARADEIRKDLDARGIVLEDGPTGTRWKRK
jgi:cysteinyl-tRNA synthetase